MSTSNADEFSQLQSEIQQLEAAGVAASETIQTQAAKIQELKSKLDAVPEDAVEVSQSDIDELQAGLAASVSALTASIQSANSVLGQPPPVDTTLESNGGTVPDPPVIPSDTPAPSDPVIVPTPDPTTIADTPPASQDAGTAPVDTPTFPDVTTPASDPTTTAAPTDTGTLASGEDLAAMDTSAPTAPSDSGTPVTDTTATSEDPTQSAAPADGTATEQPAETGDIPLYTHDGDAATVDSSEWPLSDQTTSNGQPLYSFAEDTPGEAPKGEGLGGVWHLYTGDTQSS